MLSKPVAVLFFCTVVICCYGAVDQSVMPKDDIGCKGVRSFSQWLSTNKLPFTAPSQRSDAIKEGYKKVQLGMAAARLRALMPEPDWAIQTDRGCVWRYVVTLRDQVSDGKVFSVGFDGDADVVRLVGTGDPFEFGSH
jgi:hypothetical protein